MRTARPVPRLRNSAVFSETRYAMNGDLRVAYRASPPGARDIVFVGNWFTYVTFYRSSAHSRPGRRDDNGSGHLLRPAGHRGIRSGTVGALPTLEQWADSITAILDDLESSEAVLVTAGMAFRDWGAVRCNPSGSDRPRCSSLEGERVFGA